MNESNRDNRLISSIMIIVQGRRYRHSVTARGYICKNSGFVMRLCSVAVCGSSEVAGVWLRTIVGSVGLTNQGTWLSRNMLWVLWVPIQIVIIAAA